MKEEKSNGAKKEEENAGEDKKEESKTDEPKKERKRRKTLNQKDSEKDDRMLYLWKLQH